jgi:hypothetical protein
VLVVVPPYTLRRCHFFPAVASPEMPGR